MDKYAIIIGVGGAGGHALQYIYKHLIYKDEVDFLAINLHKSDLERLEIPSTSKLAIADTAPVRANCLESRRELALEKADIIKAKFTSNRYKLAFIIAGMGGVTGMGAAPAIAEICKNTGIYTIAICSLPASFEDPRKQIAAIDGFSSLKKAVNNIAVFSNDDIFLSDPSLTIADVFQISDKTFYLPIEVILSMMLPPQSVINFDYHDLIMTLKRAQTAMFASGKGNGEKKITQAVENLKTSLYLVNRPIAEAKTLMFSIFYKELFVYELEEFMSFMDLLSKNIEVLWGQYLDSTLQPDEVKVSVILTGDEGFP